MAQFRYRGPHSGATLADGREVLLWDGEVVDLPADHPYVMTLVGLGHLLPEPQPVEPQTPAKQRRPKEEE